MTVTLVLDAEINLFSFEEDDISSFATFIQTGEENKDLSDQLKKVEGVAQCKFESNENYVLFCCPSMLFYAHLSTCSSQ